ncbi:HEAT repeat domain-containing protein, partial [Kitasatospora sp. NPDC004799]|uniref:HEAT repeat domain-containing protein n=1 Tax=Kitasatospora sp. NPDC004799 TaxID=3154460 RepID=UPI0033B4702E
WSPGSRCGPGACAPWAGTTPAPCAPPTPSRWFGLRRRGPVDLLARLAAHPDPGVRADLVWTVGRWSTPGVADLLDGLADDPHPRVREAVAAVRDR